MLGKLAMIQSNIQENAAQMPSIQFSVRVVAIATIGYFVACIRLTNGMTGVLKAIKVFNEGFAVNTHQRTIQARKNKFYSVVPDYNLFESSITDFINNRDLCGISLSNSNLYQLEEFKDAIAGLLAERNLNHVIDVSQANNQEHPPIGTSAEILQLCRTQTQC
ncbi:hypothetical protein BCR33DRAFT_740855 [Rhizoclosmatium globosum]|uniref:Uncharacterized protein n=1 Tax=Rhizoclosmatium globosum TaxID=329046 RepID=A0A1Y2BXY1_9FUNG|nr:hypothetical protein BCR33DRAFT_740855 [Rhizoclosmatium globosum]|eukprot:ORY39524.1 hypothetical protein BCR33DRAFT_740855 [Rhizoclosmatium globosum]